MPRPILAESNIHPAIRDTITSNHADIVKEVQAAMVANPVVVVGMAQNPAPKRARSLLDEASVPFTNTIGKVGQPVQFFSALRRRQVLK